MSNLLEGLKRLNVSSLDSIEASMDLMEDLIKRKPDDYIDILKDLFHKKEVAIVSGFFFNIYPDKDKRKLWAYVNSISIDNGQLRELFLTMNYRFLRNKLREDAIYTREFIVEKYQRDFRLNPDMSESLGIDIGETLSQYFRYRGVSNLDKVVDRVKVFLLHSKVSLNDFIAFKPTFTDYIKEKCKINSLLCISMDELEGYVESIIAILMAKILLDMRVDLVYKRMRLTDINNYVEYYQAIEKGMVIGE